MTHQLKRFSTKYLLISFTLLFLLSVNGCSTKISKEVSTSSLIKGFLNPPASSKPGVYWYFMDGNMTKESITADLESMKKVGIGNLIFLEVNVGIPRGKVDFLSDEWQLMFTHAVSECERLDIAMTLGIGPGWTGSGGPWVKASESMLHLVSSTTIVDKNNRTRIILPIPKSKPPFFGEGAFTEELKKQWNDYYEDVAVLAYPAPDGKKPFDLPLISDIGEKALYYRAPYSSAPGVKPYLSYSTKYESVPAGSAILKKDIIDLTDKMKANGELDWEVPFGNWIVVRFGKRNNGAITRPAPYPGLGFEADKFDTLAMRNHLDHYTGVLMKKVGKNFKNSIGGLKMLHMDSWEMGAQNWTGRFREEFIIRRGYDPLPFYPAYNGTVVESIALSERFLWDLRQTAQELVLQNHAGYVKQYANKNGMGLSIEPYDMNPNSDLELGAIADVPMAEFWSASLGFNSAFSCIEATSIAHVNGISLVPAEAFTAQNNEGWKQYPASMKNQGDWAFATGINRFVFHTFQNQTLPDSLKPGMTMGPYGVQWNRNQTWWPMAGAYHEYLSRSQYLLQQGSAVADILYLTPEGSPHVFKPPLSAMTNDVAMPDRKEFNFDGCAPSQLYKASVNDGKIVFPGGASYRILVLPVVKTMTPKLLDKLRSLIAAGAVIVGSPPEQTPGLTGYPQSDQVVKAEATKIWGRTEPPSKQTTKTFGKGKVIWGGDLETKLDFLYPHYDLTAQILRSMDVSLDFESNGPIRYTHRTSKDFDIYFVSNRIDKAVTVIGKFRNHRNRKPVLLDAVTGKVIDLDVPPQMSKVSSIDLRFEPFQSYFILFSDQGVKDMIPASLFASAKSKTVLEGSWQLSFDPKWGGPKSTTFDKLEDWSQSADKGIKYYSGIAVYKKQFDTPSGFMEVSSGSAAKGNWFLDLGEVKNMAKVKLNGKDLGVVWTAPWQVDISNALRAKNNVLEIEVANLWPNRLIGDEQLPDDGIKNGKWPEWLLKGLPRPGKRFSFTTFKHYSKDSPLFKSGLLGPVSIVKK
ncbi:glycosyl hydrolase [Pedobacter sp. JCM 36344]|uniref:glycosyl hydrolase n=1 Tax=Pedobacter sp. JCM 36344 TaxID=3374280 RepID=UPI0039792323